MLEPTLAELHQCLLDLQVVPTGSLPHDAFYRVVLAYQQSHCDAYGLNVLIARCHYALWNRYLPLDVYLAYNRLAQVASWRIHSLTREPQEEQMMDFGQ
jgi:hypothetical protein